MDSARTVEIDDETATPVARPRRRISRHRAELLAFYNRTLPSVEQTLRELETLAVKRYETKARTKNAIRNANRALAEVLQTLHSFSTYENLVAKSTVDHVHRRLREIVALDVKPKRKRRRPDE